MFEYGADITNILPLKLATFLFGLTSIALFPCMMMVIHFHFDCNINDFNC